MACTIDDKKMVMNQYNNKFVFQNVLERLGISRECAENDLVLKIIISLFQNEIELFDFVETDYFNGYEDKEESLKILIEILVRKTYEILDGKLLVENKKDACIMRTGKIVDINGNTYYIKHLHLYKIMLLDMNNRMIKKFLATELYYDKNKKTVSYRKQEIKLFHEKYSKKEEFNGEIFANINTVTGEFDASKKWKKSVIQSYYGDVQKKRMDFFDKIWYQNETNMYVYGNKVKVSHKSFDYDTHIKIKEELFDVNLEYKKVYDDYITGKVFSLQEKGNITLNLANLLEKMPEKSFDCENYMGICYCLDDNLLEVIKSRLNISSLENGNQKYKKR